MDVQCLSLCTTISGGRAESWVYPFPPPAFIIYVQSISLSTSGSADVEGVPMCGLWTCRVYPCVDVQGVSSSVDKWTMDMRCLQCGHTGCTVFLSIKSAMFSCRMYSSSPPSAVWTCRVYPPYRQQCRRAGCILLTASSVDVQGVSSLPSAVLTCRVYPPYRQQCRHAGCNLLTVSSVDMQGVSVTSLPSAV